MKKYPLLLILFCTLQTVAQQETVGDIIPYRKGKMWGLVYHSGKPFYPAVLEDVVINKTEGKFYFINPDTEAPYFLVKKGGKKYKLTPEKKLIPLAKNEVDRELFAPPAIFADEEMPPDIDEATTVTGEKKNSGLYKTIQPDLNDTALIRIYRMGDRYRFLYKGEWLSQLECDEVVEDIREQSDKWDLILRKDGKTGVAKLKPVQMAMPFRYDQVTHLPPGDFFEVQQQGKYGLYNLEENKWVIEPEQQQLQFIDKDGYGYYYFDEEGPDHIHRLIRADYSNVPVKILADSITGVLAKRLEAFTQERGSFTCFIIQKNKKYGLVDEEGNLELPLVYDKIRLAKAPVDSDQSDRLLILEQGKLSGWLDLFTHTLVSPRYTIEDLAFTLEKEVNSQKVIVFKVIRNGLSFYVDNNGKEFYSR